jgi:RNA polymerase sigma-70 factor (ECF subfamily)
MKTRPGRIHPLTQEEFLALIEKHRGELYRYVRRTLWDASKADDVFSSGVLAAYENRAQYRPGTNWRAWMFRIMTNKCYVANRETMRAFEPLEDASEAHLAVEDDRDYARVLDDPDRVLQQCGDEVNAAFQTLSEAQRNCLLLKAVEEFSYKEIAEILEIPAGTVMTHLSRGRAKLRKRLTEYAREKGVLEGGARKNSRDG